MDPSPRSDHRVLLVDEAHRFSAQAGPVLIAQMDGAINVRHVYLWSAVLDDELATEPSIVVYTPRVSSTTSDIDVCLREIAARLPTAKFILMTETVTGIKHDSIAASLIRAGIPQLVAKIKELLGIA